MARGRRVPSSLGPQPPQSCQGPGRRGPGRCSGRTAHQGTPEQRGHAGAAWLVAPGTGGMGCHLSPGAAGALSGEDQLRESPSQ